MCPIANPNLLQIDAFAGAPFSGNPAAIVLDDQGRDDSWKQAFAAEMNLSETAYLEPSDDQWNIRWFTPALEVDLCGHATLAAAHALWETGRVPERDSICFNSRSGLLHATYDGDRIWLDFPATQVTEADQSSRTTLKEALRITEEDTAFIGEGPSDAFVDLVDSAALLEFTPDLLPIGRLPFRGVVLTAASQEGPSDFLSRFFAPASGVDEDPVTGSAHCALAPYWSELLDREALLGYQASSRGGYVHTRVCGDRVALGGQARTVFRGSIA